MLSRTDGVYHVRQGLRGIVALWQGEQPTLVSWRPTTEATGARGTADNQLGGA